MKFKNRICPQCGKPFVAYLKGRVYDEICSDKCRSIREIERRAREKKKRDSLRETYTINTYNLADPKWKKFKSISSFNLSNIDRTVKKKYIIELQIPTKIVVFKQKRKDGKFMTYKTIGVNPDTIKTIIENKYNKYKKSSHIGIWRSINHFISIYNKINNSKDKK